MQKKSMALATACALVTTPVAFANPSGNDLKDPLSIGTTFGTGCTLLPTGNCNGTHEGVRLSIPSGSGNVIFKVERFNEDASKTPYNLVVPVGHIGEVGAHVDWYTGLKGAKASLDKNFTLGSYMSAQLGASIGRVEGRADLSETAYAKLNAFSYSYPGVSYHGITIPGGQISSPERRVSYTHTNDIQRSSKFGDLHESIGVGFPLSDRFQASLSQNGYAGVDRTSNGLCAGIVFTSVPDAGSSARPTGLCQGEPLKTSARFAASLAFGQTTILKDRFAAAEQKWESRVARQANNRLAPLQNYADIVRNKTGYGLTVPQLTGDDVQNFLQLETTPRISKAVVLGFSTRFGNATFSGSFSQPVGNRNAERHANVTAEYAF